jgi:zinc transporter ZupT
MYILPTGALVLCGFFVFSTVEKLVIAMNDEDSVGDVKKEKEEELEQKKGRGSTNKVKTSSSSHSMHKHTMGLAPAGVLNLVADIMHNFTDGIAIGENHDHPFSNFLFLLDLSFLLLLFRVFFYAFTD